MNIRAAMLLIAICACSGAYAEPLKRKVTEFGLYSADRKLLRQTRTIPNEHGARFGFCYEISGMEEDGSFMLVESLMHAVMKDAKGVEGTGYSVPRMYRFRNGTARGCLGYGFDRELPVTPGSWRFTISDGGDEVVVHEFTVR